MATNRKNLSVNSIEFEDIKTNLKNFLKGQTEFKDYDFEGSGMAVLIDLLAYNTYYQGFYNNVVANEMFLDSAVKRSSVVSLAKSLGYTPNSKTAPTASVDVTFPTLPTSNILLPGAQFTTVLDGKSFTFVNTESAEISWSDADTPAITNLPIKEGTLSSVSYVIPDADNNRKYKINDKDVDISTVTVRVQNSQTDTTGITDTWSRSGDFTEILSTSNVYWIEENTSGDFQIYFGDDVVGKKPEAGNLITITYLITKGTAANGAGNGDSSTARSFIYLNAGNTVEVKSVASGGADLETVDQIRFKAPRAFTSQNRAVTKDDYAALVESNFTGFDSVFVFGGEEATPPTFGSVFVAIKPSTGTLVSNVLKQQVQDFLRNKAVLSITPVVIDPSYTYIRLVVNTIYDSSKTTLSSDSLSSAITSNIKSNIDTNLGKFNQSFSISKLLADIDSTSSAIDSSSVAVTMEKRILPTSVRDVSYVVYYGNPIFHPHDGHMSVISSNTFRYLDPTDSIIKDVFIEDNGSGSLSFCQTIGQTKQIVLENAGTVDYGNGIIRINQVQILSPADDPEIKIFAIARNQRYVSVQDKILINDYLQDPSAIIVTTNVSTTTPSLSSMSEMSSTTSSSNSSSTSNSSSGGGGRNDSVVLSPDNTSATITPPRFGGY
mgnify:CR=1 FL=1